MASWEEYRTYDDVRWTRSENEMRWSYHGPISNQMCFCNKCRRKLYNVLFPFIKVITTYHDRYNDTDEWFYCSDCARELVSEGGELGEKIKELISASIPNQDGGMTTGNKITDFSESNRFSTLDYY